MFLRSSFPFIGQIEAKHRLREKTHSCIAKTCCDRTFHGTFPSHNTTSRLRINDPKQTNSGVDLSVPKIQELNEIPRFQEMCI